MTKRGQATRKTPVANTLSRLNNRVVDNLERFLPRRPELKTRKALVEALSGKGKSTSYISNLMSRKKGVSLERVEDIAALFSVDPGLFLLEVRHSKMLESIMEQEK